MAPRSQPPTLSVVGGSEEPPPLDPVSEAETDTEDMVALEFAEKYKDEMRYCHEWNQWLLWDGNRWAPEKTQLAYDFCRKLARVANTKRKSTVAKSSFAAGVERFAKTDRRIAAPSDIWNNHPWLLATPGGTVDLRTGNLRKADPSDHITMITKVAPDSECDITLWLSFLREAMGGNDEMIAFLQRMAGYCLSGSIKEHAIFFAFGGGGNGKGTFINALTNIMGDYVKVAALDMLMKSNQKSHKTEIAMLAGARMVTAQEVSEGATWDDAKIKSLTGGDKITANFMYTDSFTFMPEFKIVVSANNQPNIQTVDDAIKRRLNMMPFPHKPTVVDSDLPQKLEAEYPGILAWAIAGCLEWQSIGLVRPAVVTAATAEYFDEQDVFAQWIEAKCVIKPAAKDRSAALYESWCKFATAAGEKPGNDKSFKQSMKRSGFESIRTATARMYQGIELLQEEDMSDAYYNR